MGEALRRQLERAPWTGVKTETATMEFWKRVVVPGALSNYTTPKILQGFCLRVETIPTFIHHHLVTLFISALRIVVLLPRRIQSQTLVWFGTTTEYSPDALRCTILTMRHPLSLRGLQTRSPLPS